MPLALRTSHFSSRLSSGNPPPSSISTEKGPLHFQAERPSSIICSDLGGAPHTNRSWRPVRTMASSTAVDMACSPIQRCLTRARIVTRVLFRFLGLQRWVPDSAQATSPSGSNPSSKQHRASAGTSRLLLAQHALLRMPSTSTPEWGIDRLLERLL